MPLYAWKGIDQKGAVHSGKVFAPSYDALAQLLLSEHIGLVYARKSFIQRRLRKREQHAIIRHLASLLLANIPLGEALRISSQKSFSAQGRFFLETLDAEVRRGKALSEALCWSEFDDQVCLALVRVGESTGTLGIVLNQFVEYRKKADQVTQRVHKALMGPLITIGFFTVMMSGILAIIVPAMKDMFFSHRVSLPWITRFLIELSDWIFSFNSVRDLNACMAILLTLIGLGKTSKGSRLIELLVLSIPFIGALKKMVAQERALSVVGLLLKQGVPLSSALKVCAELTRSVRYKQSLYLIEQALHEGDSFPNAWKSSLFHCPETNLLIEIGYTSGTLADLLIYAAHMKEQYCDQKLHLVVHMINPILLLFTSICIASVTYALYMPIISFSATFDVPL